jgi:hypothetical protein
MAVESDRVHERTIDVADRPLADTGEWLLSGVSTAGVAALASEESRFESWRLR